MSEQKLSLENIISGIGKTIDEMKEFTVVQIKNEFSVHYGKYRICKSNHPDIADEISNRLNIVIINIKKGLSDKADAAKEHLEQTTLDLFSKNNIDISG